MRWRFAAWVGLAVLLACAGQAQSQGAQENDKAAASNALIAQLNGATQNKQWQQAADLAKQLIELNPDM